MTVLAPLTIPIEKYVVVDIIDGVAQTDVLHLPAPKRIHHTFEGKANGIIRFTDRIENGFPPATWPAACGAFTAGSIYVQAGPLSGRPVCPDCIEKVTPTRPKPRRPHRGAWQLTTEYGTDGLWHVRRGELETTLCTLTIALRPGRKWAPTCIACIETGRALGLTVPPFWGWNDEREAA